MSKYGEPLVAYKPAGSTGFAYMDSEHDEYPCGSVATFWGCDGDGLERAERARDCMNFAAGYTLPEDVTLGDVLDTFNRLAGEVRACWGMSGPFLRAELGNTNYGIIEQHFTKAIALIAQFKREDAS